MDRQIPGATRRGFPAPATNTTFFGGDAPCAGKAASRQDLPRQFDVRSSTAIRFYSVSMAKESKA